MRPRLLIAAILAVALAACSSGSDDPLEIPDVAVGTYDKQVTGEPTSANCGGTIGTVANGLIYMNADHTWTKIDVTTTPGGSPVCGFVGGTWVRDNTTSVTLIPGLPNLASATATFTGDQFTLSSTGAVYKRRT